jgi:hypothetical protein
MLILQRYPTPEWNWLPPVQPTEIYTWSLFRLDQERYWQIAWNEYNKRRTHLQKNYKSKPEDNKTWQEVGQILYMEMLDPQLFIELLFEHYMRNERPRPPEITEILPKLETFGLWYDETYRPDAESQLYLAGSNLHQLVSRYPDTDTAFWLAKDSQQYPPYFHLLYGASGHLDRDTAVEALRQIKQLPILRSIEEYGLWPIDAKEKLLAARNHLKPAPAKENSAPTSEIAHTAE